MKPPMCALCLRSLDDVKVRCGLAGDLVAFADHRPLPDGLVGHPHGLAWFCGDHLAAATALADRPVDEAMETLRRRSTVVSRLGSGALMNRLRRRGRSS